MGQSKEVLEAMAEALEEMVRAILHPGCPWRSVPHVVHYIADKAKELRARASATADEVAEPVAGDVRQSDPPMIEGELGYATRLAQSMHSKHYKVDAPHWKPLPDLMGVLTQIDNMVSGLSRSASPSWARHNWPACGMFRGGQCSCDACPKCGASTHIAHHSGDMRAPECDIEQCTECDWSGEPQ